MKKWILVLALGLTIAGCSKDDDKTDKKKDDSPVNTQDITDRTRCQGATPIGLTFDNQLWQLKFKSDNGITMTELISIHQGQMEISNQCEKNQTQATARASVQVQINGNEIYTITGDSNQVNFNDGSGGTCQVGIAKDKSFFYTFQGPCLKLKNANGDDEMVLVPAL